MKTVIGATLCALLVLGSPLLVATGAPTPSSPPDWFWGCWTVERLLPTSGVHGISQEQADAIIGRHIVFGRTCVRSGEVVLAGPEYSVSLLTELQFFEGGRATLKQLGINADKVILVHLTKPQRQFTPFPGDYVYLREKDVVIEVENTYFLAKRARPDVGECTCGRRRQDEGLCVKLPTGLRRVENYADEVLFPAHGWGPVTSRVPVETREKDGVFISIDSRIVDRARSRAWSGR